MPTPSPREPHEDLHDIAKGIRLDMLFCLNVLLCTHMFAYMFQNIENRGPEESILEKADDAVFHGWLTFTIKCDCYSQLLSAFTVSSI